MPATTAASASNTSCAKFRLRRPAFGRCIDLTATVVPLTGSFHAGELEAQAAAGVAPPALISPMPVRRQDIHRPPDVEAKETAMHVEASLRKEPKSEGSAVEVAAAPCFVSEPA
jgi:hypothetical protein